MLCGSALNDIGRLIFFTTNKTKLEIIKAREKIYYFKGRK